MHLDYLEIHTHIYTVHTSTRTLWLWPDVIALHEDLFFKRVDSYVYVYLNLSWLLD